MHFSTCRNCEVPADDWRLPCPLTPTALRMFSSQLSRSWPKVRIVSNRSQETLHQCRLPHINGKPVNAAR